MWALLSEKARVLVFGCHKDSATLEALLPKDVFAGVLVSDDAAVYRNFSQAQKCWAHLIRKAIKLTLQEVDYDHLITEEGVTLEGIRLVEDTAPESMQKASERFVRAVAEFEAAWYAMMDQKDEESGGNPARQIP